jgi:tetratricopeptide (TPR) repeat protein
LISLAGREGDWTAFDTLNTLRFGREGVPFAHTIVLERRRGGAPVGNTARAMARADDRELFHAADDLALFLHDFDGAEQLLNLAAASARTAAFRDSSYLRLGLLHVGQGRWSEASLDLGRAGAPAGFLARAFYASLPFVQAAPAELERIRNELEHWNPIAEPPPTASALESALAPHLRQWLLGLVALRMGSASGATDRAAIIERMTGPPGGAAAVRAMAATLRAGAAAQRNRPAEALRLLEAARGQVPASLLRVPFYAEEPARYLRAELLQQLGRDREALDWLRYGFADTPAEPAYLAPAHLRRGEIYERLGERGKAAEEYARFLHLWEHCEPELQPLLQEARVRVARLAAEPQVDTTSGRRP